jgi:DNA-binding Lrp family transcriptional regulator
LGCVLSVEYVAESAIILCLGAVFSKVNNGRPQLIDNLLIGDSGSMESQDFTGNHQLNSNNPALEKSLGLNETDRKLLELLQEGFPIVAQPWKEISGKLCLSENDLITRLKQFHENGIIHKIGPILDGRKIGLAAATLVAIKVPKNKIDFVVRIVNEYNSVSHNYEREHEYNIWFTIAASNTEQLTCILEEIKQKIGIKQDDILNLPTTNRFKINVRLQLT